MTYWADISIREWPGGGSIDVQSDYGLYAYTWYSIGDEPFRKFLCSLCRDYFMAKTRGERGWKNYDGPATIREIRKNIIEDRLEGEITKKDARSMWNSLEGKGDWLFTELVEDSTFEGILDRIYGDDFSNIPCIESPKFECLNFWSIIWPCACEIWKNELAAEKAAQDATSTTGT